MSELSGFNPAGRFTGLANIYAQCRPSYPVEAVDCIMTECNLGQGSLLIDIGCGTGISSRLFAQRGLRVIGVEPNADMRVQAESEPIAAPNTPPRYQRGYAEATGLENNVADVVLAAQAFHWFDAQAALGEFHRILKSTGHAALMWNERDESDEFTRAYGELIRELPDALRVELPRGQAGSALLECQLFSEGHKVVFHNTQTVNEESLLGRAFSASYAPREPEHAAAYAQKLRQLFAHYQHSGLVTLIYETSVYLAKRAELEVRQA